MLAIDEKHYWKDFVEKPNGRYESAKESWWLKSRESRKLV